MSASLGQEPARTAGVDADAEPGSDEGSKGSGIKSLGDLLTFAYAQGGKRFSVPVNVVEAIAARREPAYADAEGDPMLAHILDVAIHDRLLAVPPRLLIAVEDAGGEGLFRRRVANLVAALLRRHPVFRTDELDSALVATPDDAGIVFDALKSAVKNVSAADLGLSSESIKSNDREKLLSNSINALALVLAIRDRWSTEELVTRLDIELWGAALRKPGVRRPRPLLADSRTPEALGVVAQVYGAQLRRAEQRAEQLDGASQQARRRAYEAEEALASRDRELEARSADSIALNRRIEELQGALEEERQSRVVDQSHHVDDYEILRTRVVRMLARQIDLLSDGLHALRNNSTSVTEEYLERSIGALSKEMSQLKAEEGAT